MEVKTVKVMDHPLTFIQVPIQMTDKDVNLRIKKFISRRKAIDKNIIDSAKRSLDQIKDPKYNQYGEVIPKVTDTDVLEFDLTQYMKGFFRN